MISNHYYTCGLLLFTFIVFYYDEMYKNKFLYPRLLCIKSQTFCFKGALAPNGVKASLDPNLTQTFDVNIRLCPNGLNEYHVQNVFIDIYIVCIVLLPFLLFHLQVYDACGWGRRERRTISIWTRKRDLRIYYHFIILLLYYILLFTVFDLLP